MKRLINIEDRKQLFIIDAIRYFFVELIHTFAQIQKGLTDIEKKLNCKETLSEEETLHIISACWRTIDTMFRIWGLLGQVRGLSQKSPELQIFYRKISKVENFRHFYQHLNTEIPNLPEDSGPILGYVSWKSSDPKLGLTLAVGTIPSNTNLYSVAYDRTINEMVNETLFVAGTLSIDLNPLPAACEKVRNFFNTWLESKGYLAEESTHVSTFKFGIR